MGLLTQMDLDFVEFHTWEERKPHLKSEEEGF